MTQAKVAVVIPCFRAEKSIERVTLAIPSTVDLIICVDDASDDATRSVIERLVSADDRVILVQHENNKGVGGATISGYLRALEEGADILVKMDSDGQMDPSFIPDLVNPIMNGRADYVKGNRFFDIETVKEMPLIRLFGNAALSFANKVSTGYWRLFDPTNGFTAIHANILYMIPLDKVHKRYFFESDMLFRASILRCCVMDVPMQAVYRDEKSGLSIMNAMVTFPFLQARNLCKRILYNYFIRDFSVASLNLLVGIPLIIFGLIYGALAWWESADTGVSATAGTVMLSAFPVLVGLQLLLNFLQHDVASEPVRPIYKIITRSLRAVSKR